MTEFIPQFAIVGHPNEGKSSVVATLTEDDQVRISEIPGETVAERAYPVSVDGREVRLRLVEKTCASPSVLARGSAIGDSAELIVKGCSGSSLLHKP